MRSSDEIAFWRTGRPSRPLVEAGLRSVEDLNHFDSSPEARVLLEKAKSFGASHVFFRSRAGRPAIAEALVFDDASVGSSRTDDEFALLHRRLWSWGAVPLAYRRLPGRVDVFRCAHRPDFDAGQEKPRYSFHDSIETAADIDHLLQAKPWWDMRRLANGTLWDDPAVAQQLLSEQAAHKALLRSVKALDKHLASESLLVSNLRRRLLIISLLVAYLEDRQVFKFEKGFFGRFKEGAEKFFDVLGDAEALIGLLNHLETERFNGNVFSLAEGEKQQLRQTTHLEKFAQLIEGTTEAGGQQTLWRLYSFHDLPVELISQIYQLFVEDQATCVYTPPFLVGLMLEEALTVDRMDRLERRNEVVFDPSCGSGIFLVEAFTRLVLHWRSNHDWAAPPVDVLRNLMTRVRGTDVDGSAVELAAFSLCLAMCEELSPEAIFKARKLFPSLRDNTLVTACFFHQAREHELPRNIGVLVGNPPFGSGSNAGTTAQAYDEYLSVHGKQSLPDKQSAYLFLHHGMEALVKDGLLCLLQKDNFLYNRRSVDFRRAVFERWDVREILDLTPIRGLFSKDPKVVVVLAEAHAPKPERPILHAIFRRTVHTRAELSFELDYYDMQWVPRHLALAKDFVWRCNLFGGGRAITLVERLKKLPTLKEFVKAQCFDYGEGFQVGTPDTDKLVEYLYKQPVIPAKAIRTDGTIEKSMIATQELKHFQWPRPKSRYLPPLILMAQTDALPIAYWDEGPLTFGEEVLGIACANGHAKSHRTLCLRLRQQRGFFQSWLSLTSAKAGLQKATALQKTDVDNLPYPVDEADLDLSANDEIVLNDAFDFYRDFQRLGDDAAMMRPATAEDHEAFAAVFTRQINSVYKKLKPLPVKSWAGVSCQPFVFGGAEPDWEDADGLGDKLAKLLRTRKGPTLTAIRILRLFDGPFVFLVKPDRLRYWLRSIALRDADEALTDLRAFGF